MPLMTLLASAQNGDYFASVAKACGVAPALAQASLEKFCPAIATQLKSKAENDHDAFEALLDLLDEGGGSSDRDDAEAMTGAEAISDGKAVLADIYGLPHAAMAAMKALASGLDDGRRETLPAIAATSALAALSKNHGTPVALAGEPPKSGRLLGTIFSAVVAGVAQQRLAPKRRRRRSYASYFGRRRSKTPLLNDIFGQILGNLK
jgi:hypothetical protein